MAFVFVCSPATSGCPGSSGEGDGTAREDAGGSAGRGGSSGTGGEGGASGTSGGAGGRFSLGPRDGGQDSDQDGGADGGQGESDCGDGRVEGDELCEPSLDACCNDTCDGAAAAGTECRAASGACDEAELCDGTRTQCPADALKPATEVCRAAASICDAVEYCDGESAECPRDELAAPGTVCRETAGVCDVPERCTGVSANCPIDGFSPSSTQCRAARTACDAPELCDGASADCPADGPLPAGTQCRAAADACDAPELCDGSSFDCPAPIAHCDLTDLGSATGYQVATGSTTGNCNLHEPACATTGAPEAVFAFTAPAEAEYVFDTLGSDFDTVLVLLDALSCGAGLLGCGDDTGIDFGVLQSQLGLRLMAGEVVYIVVDGYGAGDSGDFVLSVRPADPASCCAAGSQPGCVDVGTTACTCNEDPGCCSGPWDDTCVESAVADCSHTCL